MPGHPDLVATTSDCGDVFMFSLRAQRQRILQLQRQRRARQRSGTKEGSSGGGGEAGSSSSSSVGVQGEDDDEEGRPEEEDAADFAPDCRLEGRTTGGFGLAWDASTPGRLLATGGGPRGSGGGGIICAWDAGRTSEGATRLAAADLRPAGHGTGDRGANDVACSSAGAGVAATVGDDGALRLHDWREPSSSSAGGSAGVRGPGLLFQAARGETLDCVAWEPAPGGHLVAAGSSWGGLYVVDIRSNGGGSGGTNGAKALLERHQHAGPVTQVAWSVGAPGVVATSSMDGFVALWDVAAATAAAGVGATEQAPRPAASPSTLGGASGRRKAAPRRLQRNSGGGGGAAGGGAGDGDFVRQHLRALGGGAEGAPRGLLFLHAGHSSVEGVAWSPERPWMAASVGRAPLDTREGRPPTEEPVVQLWQPLVPAAAARVA
jgi:WD40 repeat protein